jgi:hypothetical protein
MSKFAASDYPLSPIPYPLSPIPYPLPLPPSYSNTFGFRTTFAVRSISAT